MGRGGGGNKAMTQKVGRRVERKIIKKKSPCLNVADLAAAFLPNAQETTPFFFREGVFRRMVQGWHNLTQKPRMDPSHGHCVRR